MSRFLAALALLAFVASGCGGSARTGRAARLGVPRALAMKWEAQATTIATAAAAGKDCRAKQLAASLRDDIEQSQHKLPFRLRSPLLTGVTDLVNHTTCPVVAGPPHTKAPPPKGRKPKPKPRHPPKRHGPRGHDKGDDKGHGKGPHK